MKNLVAEGWAFRKSRTGVGGENGSKRDHLSPHELPGSYLLVEVEVVTLMCSVHMEEVFTTVVFEERGG